VGEVDTCWLCIPRAEGLKWCRCGAGARISLPLRRLLVAGELELICGRLVEILEKRPELWTTSRGGAGGEDVGVVCRLAAGRPVEYEPVTI
jgi:hypothetical protein